MSYVYVIKKAFILFPLIALLITIPFILYQYHKYGSVNKLRVLIIYSFTLYMTVIYFLIILPFPTLNELELITIPKIQYIPFKGLSELINETNFDFFNYKTLKNPNFYTMFFNIFMTIPFGIYLRYYYKCSMKKTIVLTFFLSFFFEITQITGLYKIYPKPYRICDIDDIITNTLGGMIGYFISGLFLNILPSRDSIDEKSYEKGKKVTGFRRITTFIFDLIIYFIIGLLMKSINNFTFIIIFIIYYIIIPIIFDGQTFGKFFLNLKIEANNKRYIRIPFRVILILLYYYIIPLIGLKFIKVLVRYFFKSNKILLIAYLFYALFLGIFYFIDLISILKNKTMIYEEISKTKLISTIEKKLSNNDTNDN